MPDRATRERAVGATSSGTDSSSILAELGVIDDTEMHHGNPRARVAELREVYKLTDGEIATATSADRRSVSRWRTRPQAVRTSRYDEKIEELLDVVDELRRVLTPEQTSTFLRSRNRHLDRARPLQLLGAGRHEEVRQAIAGVGTRCGAPMS
jgi:hypothetical protein